MTLSGSETNRLRGYEAMALRVVFAVASDVRFSDQTHVKSSIVHEEC